MVSERFDAAASRVSVETFGHRAGDTLAVLHLRSGLANRAERCWLLAGLRWHIVKDHCEGTLRDSAEKTRSLGSVDTLSLDVEEETLVALEVGAGAAFLTILPSVPHNLARLVNLSCAPSSTIFRSSVGALVVGLALVGEGEDAVLLGVRLALTLSQATQVASAGSRCLERSTTGLAKVLGAGETAAALVQGVHAGGAAYRGLAREGSTGAREGEGD